MLSRMANLQDKQELHSCSAKGAILYCSQRRTAAKKKDTTMSQITSFVNAEKACAGKT